MTHFYYESFQGLLQALAKDFHVYALNARTLGNIKKLPNGTHDWLAQWADDSVMFARHMGFAPYIHVRQSHGNMLGWQILITYPDTLRAYVSLAGFAPLIIEDPENAKHIARTVAQIRAKEGKSLFTV